MNMIDNGIYVLSKSDTHIMVGFNFKHFNQVSPPFFVYEGITYKRGLLDIIPIEYSSMLSSVRQYNRE